MRLKHSRFFYFARKLLRIMLFSLSLPFLLFIALPLLPEKTALPFGLAQSQLPELLSVWSEKSKKLQTELLSELDQSRKNSMATLQNKAMVGSRLLQTSPPAKTGGQKE